MTSHHQSQAMVPNGVHNELFKRVDFKTPSAQSDPTNQSQTVLGRVLSSLSPLPHSQTISSNTSDDTLSLLRLSRASSHNSIDLSSLLLKQFHSSNLSLVQYTRRASLFDEHSKNGPETHSLDIMFANFLKAYSKYIEMAIPNTINQFDSAFKPFDDDINIVLEYTSRLNQIVDQSPLFSHASQLDVYFAPPSSSNNFDDLKNASRMVKSSPNGRFRGVSGLEDIFGLFASEEAKRALDSQDQQRFILVIARSNAYDTTDDALYLCEQEINPTLIQLAEHNDFLRKVVTKQDIIQNKVPVQDFFSISYHFDPKSKKPKSFLYFKGYGQQINQRDILSKWPLLFSNRNNKNSINSRLLNNLQISLPSPSSANDQFGEYVFGLKYQFHPYQRSRRQTLTFPKEILQSALSSVLEFTEQQQLYYYLTWTCKMQLIDGQFLHYSLKHRMPKEIAIFNTELHLRHDQRQELYIVAVLNDKHNANHRSVHNTPKWKMSNSGFMTKEQIKNIYGINFDDLPKGSRALHGHFKHQMSNNYHRLSHNANMRGWHRIEKIYSQKYKHDIPRLHDGELNKALRHSLDLLLDPRSRGLELIPILNIDTKMDNIRCNSLIPIKVRNRWYAASYSNHIRDRTTVTALYIDVDDIIQKASLVSASSIERFQWLKGEPRFFEKFEYTHARKSISAPAPVPAPQPTPVVLPPAPATNSTCSTTSPPPTLPLKSESNDSPPSNSNSNVSIPMLTSLQPNISITSLQTNDVSHKTILHLQQQLNDALNGNKIFLAMLDQQKLEISRLRYQLAQKDQQLKAQFNPTPSPQPTHSLPNFNKLTTLNLPTTFPPIRIPSPMPVPIQPIHVSPIPTSTVSPIVTNQCLNGFPTLPLPGYPQDFNCLNNGSIGRGRSQSPPNSFIANHNLSFITPPSSAMNLGNNYMNQYKQ